MAINFIVAGGTKTDDLPCRRKAAPHEIVQDRVRCLNPSALSIRRAKYVLYWAQMNRRVAWNHALLYAAELANRARAPVAGL